VELGDDVGTGVDEDLVAALVLGSSEVLGGQLGELQVRPRGAVVDDDPLPDGAQVGVALGVRTGTRLPERSR
jgi:hypothetical protein